MLHLFQCVACHWLLVLLYPRNPTSKPFFPFPGPPHTEFSMCLASWTCNSSPVGHQIWFPLENKAMSLLRLAIYWLPKATGTKYHKLSGLKCQKSTVSQFGSSDIQNRGVDRIDSSWRSRARHHSMAFGCCQQSIAFLGLWAISLWSLPASSHHPSYHLHPHVSRSLWGLMLCVISSGPCCPDIGTHLFWMVPLGCFGARATFRSVGFE